MASPKSKRRPRKVHIGEHEYRYSVGSGGVYIYSNRNKRYHYVDRFELWGEEEYQLDGDIGPWITPQGVKEYILEHNL